MNNFVSNKRHQVGFSLIELLVVMVIVAVIAAGVSLAINPQGSTAKRINQQGDRLFAQMQFALDDALVRNQALGIVVLEDEGNPESIRDYSWRRFDGKTFDKKTDGPLGNQSIDEGLDWSFEIEDLSLEESLDSLLDEEQVRPIVTFSPSGEVSDIAIVITLSEELLAENPEASQERYKIALDDRGVLVRYPVGVEEE